MKSHLLCYLWGVAAVPPATLPAAGCACSHALLHPAYRSWRLTCTTHNTHHTACSIDDQWALDATVKGGFARFINHSCNPNCYTRKFTVPGGGGKRIGIFAKRKIPPGEELCYDYQFEYEEGERRVRCCCGAAGCRGWMN